MMLSIRDIISSSKDVRKGNWDCEKFVGRQIDHLRIGVIGFGRLGKMFASYAHAFNAKVYIYDPHIKNTSFYPEYNFTSSLFDLAKKVDIVSLHVHVTKETKEMLAIYGRSLKGASNKNEMSKANEQFRQILKNAGIGFLIIFPFAPITIPLVVYLGKLFKIDILPKSFYKTYRFDSKSK